MSNSKQSDGGGVNGIIATKNGSTQNVCENTTPKWTRRCPQCNDVLEYGTAGNRNLANRENRLCRSCTFSGRHPSDATRRRMSSSQTGRKHSDATLSKMRGSGNGMYGVHRYDNLNPFYGKRHAEESRRRMRVAACLRVISLQRASNGRVNNVGKREGAYFSKLEQDNGWNGVYFAKCGNQHFVDHVGYFVDYYEPFYNIVVEYDESRHYKNGMLKERPAANGANPRVFGLPVLAV